MDFIVAGNFTDVTTERANYLLHPRFIMLALVSDTNLEAGALSAMLPTGQNQAPCFAALDKLNVTRCKVQHWLDIRTPLPGTCELDRLIPDLQ